MAALTDDQITAALNDLPGWSGDASGLRKTFDRGDFVGAMGFVQQIGLEAERLFHHPDLAISYKRVDVTIVSHDQGGVTEQCVDLAKRIESRA